MKLKELLGLIENGSVHFVLINHETGVVMLKTIWQNDIPETQLDREVLKIRITDYKIILEVM